MLDKTNEFTYNVLRFYYIHSIENIIDNNKII